MAILVEISVSAGAYQSGGVTVASTATIQARLSPQTTSGVWAVQWDIYEAPPAATCPSGWTDNGDGTFGFLAGASTSLMPPVIALTGKPWGKWLLRATANGGVLGGVVDLAATRDEATAWSVESPGGTEDVAALEGTQFNPNGVIAIIKEAFRGPMFIYADAASLLRTGYDFNLIDESVPNDGAGTTWQALLTWTRAQLASVDGTTLAITFDIRVTEDEFGANDPKDEVTAVFVYTRRDAYSDTITNKISGVTATSATPSVEADGTLPAAAAADAANAPLKVRLRRGSGGTSENIYFEVLRHISQDRRIDVEAFLGSAW